jgi:putative ABC transport system permease protein
MWYNYFKIALRNISKGKLHSAINIIGLSVGAAVCILIMLFISDEWSYDKFHSKSDRIYRAWVKEHYKGDIFFNTVTPFILGPELKANFPEIETVTRYTTINSLTRKSDFSESEIIHLVDPEFFDVFDFRLLKGKKDQVLNGVHQAIITPEIGKKYFGDKAPVGQVLAIQVAGEWTDFTISGIIENPPSNSSIQYDILIPYENVKLISSDAARNSRKILHIAFQFLL